MRRTDCMLYINNTSNKVQRMAWFFDSRGISSTPKNGKFPTLKLNFHWTQVLRFVFFFPFSKTEKYIYNNSLLIYNWIISLTMSFFCLFPGWFGARAAYKWNWVSTLYRMCGFVYVCVYVCGIILPSSSIQPCVPIKQIRFNST